jgi:hypothetical protein
MMMRTTAMARRSIEISPEAISLFKAMRSLEPCSCLWGPHYFDRQECATCAQWWDLHAKLHGALGLSLTDWPVLDHDAVDVPPHDELEGGKLYRANVSHNGGPECWPGAKALFKRLMQATGQSAVQLRP